MKGECLVEVSNSICAEMETIDKRVHLIRSASMCPSKRCILARLRHITYRRMCTVVSVEAQVPRVVSKRHVQSARDRE